MSTWWHRCTVRRTAQPGFHTAAWQSKTEKSGVRHWINPYSPITCFILMSLCLGWPFSSTITRIGFIENLYSTREVPPASHSFNLTPLRWSVTAQCIHSIWSKPVWGLFWSLKCFSTIRILTGVFICLYSKYLNMFQVQQSTYHWAERIKMTQCILAHTSAHTFQTNSYFNIKCRPFWLKWQSVNHPLNSSTEALQWRTW